MSKLRLPVLMLTALWFAACSAAPSGRELAQEAVTAMGGIEQLRNIRTITMSGGAGTRSRLGQTVNATDEETPGELKDVVEIADLASGRASLDYVVSIGGGFSQHRHEILTKKNGTPVGVEIIPPRPTIATSPGGLFSWGTQNSPEFLLRRNVVSIILAAAESAADAPAEDRELNGRMLKYTLAKGGSGEEIGLYFDPESKLLAAYEALDTEALLGDLQAQYILDDYKPAAGVTLPHHITIRKGGRDFSEVRFSAITINDPAAEQVFEIPEAAAAEADVAVATGDYSPIRLTKVDEGVYQAQGYSHHSLVVEFPQYLAIVDAPYTVTQTKSLARTLEQQFPGKPLRYAAVSHHHFDHIGGIREAAALGATVLVEKRQEAVLRPILEARLTNPQDELDKRRNAQPAQTAGSIEVYEGRKIIGEGSQSLELIPIAGGPHVEPMVLGYVPSARAVFQPDLYTPGAGGGPAAEHLLKSIQELGIKVDKMVGGHGGVGSYADFVKAAAPKTSSD